MLGPTSPSLVEIIGQIYEAAENSQAWHAVVHRLGCEMGSTANVLSVEDVGPAAGSSIVNDGFRPNTARDYVEHYYSKNIILERVKPLLRSRPVMTSSDVVRDSELVNTELYQGFMRPHGVFYLLGGLITPTSTSYGIITLARSHRLGPWTREEREALGVLLPHFRRALRLGTHLTQLRAERDDLLNRFGTGVILIGHSGEVQFMNHAAEEILSRKDGLQIRRDGSLVASEPGQTARIAQLVAAARQTACGKSAAGAGSLSLVRPSLRRPYSMLGSSLDVEPELPIGRRGVCRAFRYRSRRGGPDGPAAYARVILFDAHRVEGGDLLDAGRESGNHRRTAWDADSNRPGPSQADIRQD
jgi:PAS domain-containing protein